MAAIASAIQIQANRTNAASSTGPRTPEGKLASSTNALTHGLTTEQALLPTEDPAAYTSHHAAYHAHYKAQNIIETAAVTELADLRWRLRRVPGFESRLLAIEMHNLSTNPDFESLNLRTEAEILAMAFTRLIQSRVLQNLYNLEARLARRACRIEQQLDRAAHSRPCRQPSPQPEPEPEPEDEIQQIEPISPVHPGPKTGRNQLCPCNSGLKFKRCCLNNPRPLAAA